MEKSIKKSSCLLMVVICLFGVSTVNSQIALTKALDYDGDGKTDFSVLRPKNNIWYIRTSGGASLSQQLGNSALDTPTPGDYDGDGRGDVAVWRESTGAFLYFQSSNGAFITKYFGQAGDEPVARDYDGDGKTDLAVVRPEGVL